MSNKPPIAGAAPDGDDDDDDYMTMTFANEPSQPQPETSLQRRERLRREGAIRGMVKSKAQLAAEEAERRERALATSMLDEAEAKRSKGFAMMAKMGFKKGGTLGKASGKDAVAEPIKVNIKGDRGGIGLEAERKRKMEEAAEREGAKRPKPVDPLEYRDRVRRERALERMEGQFHAAQRLAERMDEEKAAAAPAAVGRADAEAEIATADEGAEGEPPKRRTISARPLKSVNILWRGLVRARDEAERDRRMRRDLEQSLSRLPTYDDEDEDADDRRALGKAGTVFDATEDLDEEDPELEAFEALEVEEKLRRVVRHLREEHRYCFWCKFTYPDEAMDGCPGETEEDHD